MFQNQKKIVLLIFTLVMVAVMTACRGDAGSENEVGQVISPTVLVTVFVTPVTATPMPVTPQPTPIPPQPTAPPVVDPNAPWNAPVYFPGPGCGASRLHIEDRAFVAATGHLAKIYLSKNLVYDPGVRDLVPGEEMTILAGPYCDEDWVIWLVKMDVDEIKGWVPEGDGETYYLLPSTTQE